jgi:hypothetical protein
MIRQSGTYEQIQRWLVERYGFRPEPSWITHCKEIYGLPVSDRADSYRPPGRQCPSERRPLIREAFEHFGLLPKTFSRP